MTIAADPRAKMPGGTQKAGVRCVCVLSGGISRAELAEAGAAEVHDGPADLLAAFPGGLLGAR